MYMSNPSPTRSLLVISSVIILVATTTYIISLFARGYQINFQGKPSFKSTGILSATSSPKAASVYINDRLMTATDDTLNLPPDEYTIRIVKDGYLPWEKTIKIKNETVYQTNAQLYRSVPDLKPITLTGAINPSYSLDSNKIVYSVASSSAERDNGLYLIELTDSSPIPINRSAPRQIAPDFPNVNWSHFTFTFSPNSRQILAQSKNNGPSYLLELDSSITQSKLMDVTAKLPLIKEDWDKQSALIIASKITKLPKSVQDLVATDSSKNISFSTSDEKVLYLAKKDGQIPDHIISPPPAQSTQPQHRDVKAGNYYVYDLIDDTNFLIGSQNDISSPVWLPNSNNIIFIENEKIIVVEYDSTNKETLFAGNFNKDVVYPWSDGSRIILLTSAYIGIPDNLYSVTIR